MREADAVTLLPGKLPVSVLADLLATIPADPRVLLGPGIGRDAAVIDLGGDRLLVATTDPVTFAGDDIGWYAVHVNANDIACMGARPAWFLATALLPPGAPDSLPGEIFGSITAACAALGIALVGGHTEVTLGLDRPVVAGVMLGEATRDEIVRGENIEAGDAVLLSQGIAIEGTALLAREAAARLAKQGVVGGTIARARAMLYAPGISVVGAARELCSTTRPRLMHDPTEGGLATALHEMASAVGASIRIEPESVVVFDETRTICEALGLDPWGLLASGALLAIVPGSESERLTASSGGDTIQWHRIGSIERGEPRVILGAETNATPLPTFDRDEVARFFESGRRD